MRSAVRYLRRGLGIMFLSIAACVWAFVLVTRTRVFNELLREELIAFVAAHYRGTVQVARIEGSVWGSLRLEQVALLYEGRTIYSTPRLSLNYSLLPLLWRTLHLRIAIDSPRIEASRQPDGQWNLLDAVSPRTPITTQLPFTIYLDSLQVNDGALEVTLNGSAGRKYHVGDLNLDAGVTLAYSRVSVNLRRLTAAIAAPFRLPVQAGATLDYDVVASTATVHVTDLNLRTPHSFVSINGELRFAQTPNVDLKVVLDRLAASELAQLYPASRLKADLGGTITLRGPEDSLRGTVELNFAGAALDGTIDADVTQRLVKYAVNMKLSNADLQRVVKIDDVAGVFDATIKANGMGIDVGATNGEFDLHGRNLKVRRYTLGTIDLAATAAHRKARLTMAVAAPAGNLTASGTVGIAADSAYHFDLATRHLNLAKAGFANNISRTNLNLTAQVDGHGLAPASADTAVKLKADRSQVGGVVINGGLFDARIKANRVNIAQLYVETAQSTLEVRGSAALAADEPSDISYAVHSSNVGEVSTLAGIKANGRFDLHGTVKGRHSDLRTRGTLEVSSLQAASCSLQHALGQYSLVFTGPDAPYGTIDTRMNGVRVGAELRMLSLRLEVAPGAPHAATLRLNAIDRNGREDLVATHFTYRPPSISGELTEMTLGLSSGQWHLASPADYTQTRWRISISRLKLQSGTHELALQGTLGQEGRQDFDLMLSRFDLAALHTLTPRLNGIQGMLSTTIRIGGTAVAPAFHLATQAAALGVNKQIIGDVSATIDYEHERASFTAVLRQNAADHLTATASMPMRLSWNRGVKATLGDSVELMVNSARLGLAQLGSLFPGEARDFEGAAAINLSVRGELRQPQATGSIKITGVRGQIVPLGVRISDAQLIVDVDPGGVHIQTIEAHAGRGTVSGNGALGLTGYVPGALAIRLTFTQWPAINTPVYKATIGGHLTTDGTFREPRLNGQLEVLDGLIQPDLGFLGATSNLSVDQTIEVIRPGGRNQEPLDELASTAGFAPPTARPHPSVLNNLAMKVGVSIHRNTWIRNPDAAAELEGNLEVEKKPGGKIRVVGEVRTVRGSINYYNRQFTLRTGVFSFTGGPKIDPQLDIDAQYRVNNYIVDILAGGTASKPTLQLKSQPELAQADILSLILFGKTTDALGRGQRFDLEQQATKLAAGVAAQQFGRAVASAMGLQRLGITLENVGSGGTVGISRYLGENAYVSASPLAGGGGKFSLQYFLLPWVSITTSAGADGSPGIELNLVKQY
jgi:autotransporter translocation and assembly factor TamB